MNWLIIIFLGMLATVKVSAQSRFGRTSIKNGTDAIFFNCILFLFTAIIFFSDAVNASSVTVLYAAMLGVIEISYQFFYINSLSLGSVSLTILIVNLFNVIPVILSALVFGDAISPLRITGIVMTLLSFAVCTDFSFKEKNAKKWFLCTLGVAVASASANVLQKFFAESPVASENSAFVSWGYIFAFVFSLAFYLVNSSIKEKKTFKTSPRVFVYAAICGGLLAVYMYINTKALTFIPGTFFFPAYSGISTILSTMVGIILFKDKLSKKQFLGIAVGIIALVLVNM